MKKVSSYERAADFVRTVNLIAVGDAALMRDVSLWGFGRPRAKRRPYGVVVAEGKAKVATLGRHGLRLTGLENLVRVRHGAYVTGPAAYRYLFVAAHIHAGALRDGITGHIRFHSWAAKWTPEVEADDIEDAYVQAMEDPLDLQADELGKMLGVTEVFRRFCYRKGRPLHMIGAMDSTKADRNANRNDRKREAITDRRRAEGVKPRTEWLAENRKGEADKALAEELGVKARTVRSWRQKGTLEQEVAKRRAAAKNDAKVCAVFTS